MKTIVFLLLPFAMFAADQKKPAKPIKLPKPLNELMTGKKSGAAKKAAPAKPTAAQKAAPAIPPEAVQVGPETYRYTDKAGKTWIYRRTPFGISKAEEQPEQATPSAPAERPEAPETPETPVKVSVDGDVVRFERPSPFGNQSWTKKKSELTDEERAWVDAQKEAGSGSANRTKTTEK